MTKKEWRIDAKFSYKKITFRDIYTYKYLLKQLVYRDFVASYRQTVLGPAWFIVHPIITAGVFTFVFGNIVNIHTNGIPKPIFYLTGLAIWSYFSECTTRISSVFKDNIETFGKVYFPRILVPLTISISMALRLIIQLLIITVILFSIKLANEIPSVPRSALLIMLASGIATCQAMGMGLIIASLTIKYRDLNFLTTFTMQLMMYATTLFFPLSAVPKHLQIFVQVNPMTTVIETFRFALLNNGNINYLALVYSFFISLILLIVGVISYEHTGRTFIDKI
ncbi:ABC transporter permease [Pedobacter sp. PWIIR3]